MHCLRGGGGVIPSNRKASEKLSSAATILSVLYKKKHTYKTWYKPWEYHIMHWIK